MRRPTILLALSLVACGPASADPYDPADDVHCHALSLYWTAATLKEMKADRSFDAADFSALVVGEWYRTRFAYRASLATEARAKALYETIGSEWDASKRAYVACGERAAADPRFDAFARRTVEDMRKRDWDAVLARLP